jgi:hypothetical protein
LARMRSEVEAQIACQGTYVPFGPLRLAVAQKVGPDRRDVSNGM